MTWPYVRSFHDAGVARGPRLAFVVHMAEGGGTVGFLSRRNTHGVSVHFVIEYSGRVVRMLPLDHMHTSLRTSAIRRTDDPDGLYGRAAALRVMGEWADTARTLGPNHASIAVEIEGFARSGPNAAQASALRDLYAMMRVRYPTIRALGHRDFADYKACPGRLIDWAAIGGHAGKDIDMKPAPVTDESPKLVTANDGHTWRDLDGTTVLDRDRPALASRISPFGITNSAGVELRAIFANGPGDTRRLVTIVPATVTDLPSGDCADEIAADRLRARITYD